jgi:quinol monooxygenase YgiN
MSELQVTASFKISKENLADFKAAAMQCMDSVRTKDKGTLQYDWFFNADETSCIVLETYKDSASVFEHIGNLGEVLGALMEAAPMELEVFGNPNDELREALSSMTAKVYSPFQSM